jgi:prepilin-type N-terminal cleavage/methylation domain-containing protein
MKRGQNKQGFTIVEVLIVIVVIAIIAAVTIVAYNGVQAKADFAAAVAEHDSIQSQIDSYAGSHSDNYPTSITDCPAPADANICITPESGHTLSYYAFSGSVPPRFSAALHSATTAYELGVLLPKSFYYFSNAEITGSNEFVQYMDMAPIINKYGIRKYKISFDIKSASIASASSVNVYMQNGSGARYTFSSSVPVTTSFQRKTITVTPSGPNTTFTQSILAFYGTYSTGNRPTIRDVEITAG